jgi:hypothetical protein
VFIHVPKCAGQSVRHALRTYYGGDEQRGEHHHTTALPAWAREFFAFAIVRNPYDRAISLWFSMVKTREDDRYGLRKQCGSTELLPFLRWLVSIEPYDPILYGQAAWLRDTRLDRVLRFENLQTECERLPFWPAAKPGPLPFRNRSKGRLPWTIYCDSEAIALIEQWAGDDFEAYGYARQAEALAAGGWA